MKVLCATTSGAGHYRPLFPVARALTEAGHQVVFTCPDSAAGAIAGAGFEVSAFDDADPTPEQVDLFQRAEATGDARYGQAAAALGFGYVWPTAALPRLRGVVDEYRPALVIRDPAEMASLMLCEEREIPSAMAMGGLQATFELLGSMITDPLARLRASVGNDPSRPMATDELILTSTPPSFDVPSTLAIEVQRYGLEAPLRSLTGDLGIYATLGTEVAKFAGGGALLRRIVDVLANLDIAAVLTTGVDPREVDLGEVPPHVDIRRFVPHEQAIPASRVVITHGGAGTVQDALLMGRPMVVLPQFADQFANGDRVEEVGVGRVLAGDQQTTEQLAAAVQDVLSGRFDRTAWDIAEEAAALPPIAAVIDRLERISAG